VPAAILTQTPLLTIEQQAYRNPEFFSCMEELLRKKLNRF